MTNISKQERMQYIGASEVAAIFGLSPYATPYQLWHQKNGTLPVPDLDDSERIQAGLYLEPAIARWASSRWNEPIRKVRRYISHPKIDQFGCSLDYETTRGLIPVEIKNVDGLVFRDEWEAMGDRITDWPMHIALQQQAQMACTGKTRSILIVCVGGNRLFRADFEADAAAITKIEHGVKDFWASITIGAEPSPDWYEDAAAILAMNKRGGAPDIDLRGDNHAEALAHEYIAASAAEKAAERRKTAAKSELITRIGAADRAFLNGFSISAKEVRESAVSYVRGSYRNFRITEKKQQEKAA